MASLATHIALLNDRILEPFRKNLSALTSETENETSTVFDLCKEIEKLIFHLRRHMKHNLKAGSESRLGPEDRQSIKFKTLQKPSQRG